MQPRSDAVWADGSWEWDVDTTDENGGRYRWQPGAWVVVPEGVSYARWIIVRRKEDGQLFFAPSTWHDAKGRTVSAPEAITRAQSGRSQIEE